MDTSGQLTFSDDPLLNGTNEAYLLIEEGNFSEAVEKLDELMNINPDYPGLIDAYRIAKFWNNREKELNKLSDGKETADFLMKQWNIFEDYAITKKINNVSAHHSAMRYIFFKASENYKVAFKNQEDTSNNFDLLLNLGNCFLRLEEYKFAIDTLEYARSSYKSNAQLLAILGEAYYHMKEIPKSLLCFKEAFFINPSEIDLQLLKSEPIRQLVELVKQDKFSDIEEWVPIYGFLHDIFYVRKNLNRHLVESIENEIYNLEINYQKLNKEQLDNTKIIPRLINKYLWMLDYYEFQNYNFDHLMQIRERLLKIDKDLFEAYFKNHPYVP